jgi:hypothetical protein
MALPALWSPGSHPPGRSRRADRAKDEYFLQNRLNFAKGVSAGTPFDSEQWTPSDKAPFQAFPWTHYPSTGPGKYTCTVYAAYFADGGGAYATPDT